MFSAPCRLPQNLVSVALSKLDFEFTRNSLKRMVGLEGFEPPTHGLGNRCSIRLSYRPVACTKVCVYSSTSAATVRPEIRRHALKLLIRYHDELNRERDHAN
jgi:hypothetical protein